MLKELGLSIALITGIPGEASTPVKQDSGLEAKAICAPSRLKSTPGIMIDATGIPSKLPLRVSIKDERNGSIIVPLPSQMPEDAQAIWIGRIPDGINPNSRGNQIQNHRTYEISVTSEEGSNVKKITTNCP